LLSFVAAVAVASGFGASASADTTNAGVIGRISLVDGSNVYFSRSDQGRGAQTDHGTSSA
jgi:hypothetical protein